MKKSFFTLLLFLTVSSHHLALAQNVNLDNLDPLSGKLSLKTLRPTEKILATPTELQEAMNVKDCGYFVKVAIDDGQFVYPYGLLNGQTIRAPYSKTEIENILFQCEFFREQKLNGKIKKGETFYQK